MNATEFFTSLEQEFNGAVARRDSHLLDSRFLAPDYALRISLQPDRPLSRQEWLEMLRVYNVHQWGMRVGEVRDLGNVAIAHIIITQNVDVDGVDRSGDFFLVDVWQRISAAGDRLDPKAWRLAARYSSPLQDVGLMPGTR